jgi:hypothetical protein
VAELAAQTGEAFIRPLRFTVAFPTQGIDERHRICARIWLRTRPAEAGLNLDQLAGEVRVSGGAIHSTALAGAFLAADGVIVRRHSPRVQKLGKVQPHQRKA